MTLYFFDPGPEEVSNVFFVSLVMAATAGFFAILRVLWAEATDGEWQDDADHFGISYSFEPDVRAIGSWLGSIIGHLFDAVRTTLFWAVISAWWLNAVYLALFIIYNIFIRQIYNIWKSIKGLCARLKYGAVPRFLLQALFHATLALLFHFILWQRRIPYPTLWGWIKFIKINYEPIQSVVLGSIALSFVLSGLNLTVVELVMLPITLPIRIFKLGIRMEQERYERERAGRNEGPHAASEV
ncbi:hypothetical protein RQP46_008191 [Phenoliferia psychrophenolica]